MGFRQDHPRWDVEGKDWPNRETSRFVEAGGLRWHVQMAGEGPALLLLHGTGAATHSWRGLLPLLATRFRVIAPDLPGHGFTAMPVSAGLSLRGMSGLVDGLLRQLDIRPDVAVGHSAGAAILAAMVIERLAMPKTLVALNGALLPMRGAGLFGPLARLLFLNPLAPRIFSWRAEDMRATRKLLEGTGSVIDARGIEFYARLFRKPGHVAATLGMMANWELDWLERRLPRMDVPLLLVTGVNDRAVAPAQARDLARRLEAARLVELEGGHLVHEERPADVARVIIDEVTIHIRGATENCQ
ncbi:alpha/beta fold hydrolase [Chelativorans sp. ZYF759]|uniref:alpha/beta fold hydrolase BchO n=1 Tax=Chelativorans sp. ZYF759 TaxID=2692213 RepID=UPI00145DFFD0|nr:alpha/beta fold hydrolase BchO [Chelativorans sp. ZYF759]NMG41851.1 alpha/beta fold hydrolase [Chelativorans sp. ZYF759]